MVREVRANGNAGRTSRWLILLGLLLMATNAAGQYALQFDGVDDYVDIGPWPELTSQIMAQPVTYEFWLSSTNTTDTLTLIGAVNTADSTFYRISLNMDGMRVRQAGGVKILQRDASGTFFRGGTASGLDTGITNGEWHHMALVFDANTGFLAIYVDGVSQELSFMDAATPTNVTDFEYPVVPIGARNVRGVIDQCFAGLLNEVRMWSYARAEAEIQSNMTVAVPAGVEGLIGYWPLNEGQGGTAYDNSGNGRDGIITGPTWTTESAPVVQPFAFLPIPADGAVDVAQDIVLNWSVATEGQRQNVYVGDDLTSVGVANADDPLGVLVARDTTATTYAPPGGFQYGQTYYWRIDEAGSDELGRVWSFTIEPPGYPLAPEHVTATASSANSDGEGPENVVDGSGLDADGRHSTTSRDMWLSGAVAPGASAWIQFEFDKMYSLHQMQVWNHNSENESLIGFGIKEAIVERSLDGEDWTVVSDAQELGRAAGMPDYEANTAIDFGGAVARFVRITAVSSWGGFLPQFGLSEVRFLYVPVAAREPQPVDGSTGVDPAETLSWRAGREAAAHEVYMGTEAAALELVDTVAEAALTPDDLLFGRDYYWRVDEVNEAATTPVWAGDLWSFTTQEFVLIDGFESYNDQGDLIYEAWADGWINGSGSTVGYLIAPFAERTIVHSGGQSMPLAYDNSAAPFYSDAEYDLGGMDWDAHGADTLRVYVAGSAPAFAETADGTIFMNGIGTDIWGTADEFRYAYKRLSGDGALVARVDSLADSDVWAKGGVMIRETMEPGSKFAAVYLTGNNGVRYQARLEADVDAVSDSAVATDEQLALREPVWVKIERVGDTFNGYYSSDGANWTAMAWNPQTINMANDVTIGLALTSHNATVSTGAAFADVTETGGVSGVWQVVGIGVEQPSEGNDPETMYVAVEDSGGNVAVVTHADAAVRSEWVEWSIPFEALAGVNLNSVRTLYIGLGDRDNPSAGGSGLVFIDDIAFGHPAGAGTE